MLASMALGKEGNQTIRKIAKLKEARQSLLWSG